MTHRDIRS